jgi:hypothetical protein
VSCVDVNVSMVIEEGTSPPRLYPL